ncbi:MAG: hypothetical protein HOV87_16315 [Catenulispora sp.]|nr:hypothetical protein [Catenulispora sp.]
MHNHHLSSGHRPTPPPSTTGYRYGHGGAGPGLYRGHVPIAPNIHQGSTRRRTSSTFSKSRPKAARTLANRDKPATSSAAADTLQAIVLSIIGVLIWWGIGLLTKAAHQHHQPLLTFIAHSLASRQR